MSLDISLDFDIDTGNEPYQCIVYDANYTHNVTAMWRLAGVYDVLYNFDGQRCGDHIETLRAGIKHMEDFRFEYIPLNPPNGWGSYDTSLPFLRAFLEACIKYPNAKIGISK